MDAAIAPSFITGFATSAALIVAIGAQNAFVLRQGLKRSHVLPVVLVCALSDMLLIGLGVSGFGALVQASPTLLAAARWGGALFLIGYGLIAARRALGRNALALQGEAATDLRTALLTCLAFTYLNPHCWLDTVVLLGAVSAQQAEGARVPFGIGAASASAVWFFALGYGARLLAPLFARPVAWRVLDGGIALVMWTIAAMLVRGV
ncbi:MAG: amino acid transporter [Methylibium sp. NZG]|nr:MAG: amino acid transporter [Methylibium sp. NZG]